MKSNPTDHDLLVEHSVVLRDGFARLDLRMKELGDGTASKLLDHDIRIRKIEDLILSINPVERIKTGDAMMSWVNDFRSRWRVYVAISSIVISILVTILTTFIIKRI